MQCTVPQVEEDLYLIFSYYYDSDAFIEYLSIGFIQTMVVFGWGIVGLLILIILLLLFSQSYYAINFFNRGGGVGGAQWFTIMNLLRIIIMKLLFF